MLVVTTIVTKVAPVTLTKEDGVGVGAVILYNTSVSVFELLTSSMLGPTSIVKLSITSPAVR